jgi:hypothetical protein
MDGLSVKDVPVVVTRSMFLGALKGGFESAESSNTESVRVLEADSDVSVTLALAQIDYVTGQMLAEPGHDDVMLAPRDRITSLFLSYLAERMAKSATPVRPVGAGGYEADLDGHDLAWATKALIPWIRQRLKQGRCEWKDAPAPVEALPNKCRMAVLGDWGTGMYGAPLSAQSIERDGDFQVLLHLGDVYYTGTADEILTRFLAYWPKIRTATTRCLNGNHEMYSGGTPYFGMLPHFDQHGSYFAMQNDHWLFVGLDTSYTEYELEGAQVAWLAELVARAGERKIVLLSHHQPFSIDGKPTLRLISQLAPFLDRQQIFAWYWGHEHWCAIFDRHKRWNMYGRCVGHGGMPEFRSKSLGQIPTSPTFVRQPGRGSAPGYLFLDGPNTHVKGHASEYTPHGYLVLELDGPQLTEEYYEAAGFLLERRTLA